MTAMPLQETDKVEVLTILDNSVDLLMASTEQAKRFPLPPDPLTCEMLVAEHGFAALVTVSRGNTTHSFLLDAGLSKNGLMHNMDVLEVKPKELHMIVLSHGHIDHTNGLMGMDFLAVGESPIYVGFGSMVGFAQGLVMKEVLAALDGRRALLSSGWNEFGSSSLPSNFFPIGPTPHDQLFPHVSIIIHHGGAGTSHSAAAAGVPSVVVPFTGDQPFWASRLKWAGVAPDSVPYNRFDSGLLRTRIQEASATGMRQRAEVLGRLIRAEKGVHNAIARLEQLLAARGTMAATIPQG